MLCLPGLTPVAKLDQAVGDSEGWVEPSVANVPASARRFRFGSLPSSMNRRASVGSMPSKPITTTRCLERRAGFPAGDDVHAVSTKDKRTRATGTRNDRIRRPDIAAFLGGRQRHPAAKK